MSSSSEQYTDACCDPESTDCTPPDLVVKGRNVRLSDKYGCEKGLEDKAGTLLVGDVGDTKDRVRFKDGSKADPITLPNVQKNTVVKELGGFLDDGTLTTLEPDPDVAGIQVPEYEDDEWRMVAKNAGQHCFPSAEILDTDIESFSGLAAFEECETGTVCLRTLGRCEAHKLFTVDPGAVILWAGCPEVVPEGYTICDGKSLVTTTYPDAFQAIGYKWGGGGDVFRVPDLRGRVARGVDDDQLRDKTARQAENGSAELGVGSYQNSYLWNHSHDSGVDEGNAVRQVRLTLNKKTTTVGNHGTKSITYVQGISKDELEADIDVTVGGPTDWAGCTAPSVTCEENTMHNAALYYLMATGCAVE